MNLAESFGKAVVGEIERVELGEGRQTPDQGWSPGGGGWVDGGDEERGGGGIGGNEWG